MEPICAEWAMKVIAGLIFAIGCILWYFFRKFDRKLEELFTLHSQCQIEITKRFLPKEEFSNFIQSRSADHTVINQRLHGLEINIGTLMEKMTVFMDDTSGKLKRLSETFVLREAAISSRIDNIAMNHAQQGSE